MSKSTSGHFKNTQGILNHPALLPSRINIKILEMCEKEKIVPHPTKFKQLSYRKKKLLRNKLDKRTITREEYKLLEWNRRLSIRRNKGIDNFWRDEYRRLKNNLPRTRNWKDDQKADILVNKRPKFDNVTMQSHHMFSVKDYPHLANRGDLIFPATAHEHFAGWHGGKYTNSLPGVPIIHIVDF